MLKTVYTAMRNLVALCLPAVLLLNSCNRCKTDPILIYANPKVVDIGIFKPGTLWVYQNINTLETDSVMVTGYAYVPDTIRQECKGQPVDINYSEHYDTYSNSSFYETSYVSTVPIGQVLLVAKEGFPADTLYSAAPCADAGYCAVFDTFKVNRTKYVNVYERIDSASSLYDNRLVHFYSAPYFGLIRKDILNEDGSWETWNLVQAVIIQ